MPQGGGHRQGRLSPNNHVTIPLASHVFPPPPFLPLLPPFLDPLLPPLSPPIVLPPFISSGGEVAPFNQLGSRVSLATKSTLTQSILWKSTESTVWSTESTKMNMFNFHVQLWSTLATVNFIASVYGSGDKIDWQQNRLADFESTKWNARSTESTVRSTKLTPSTRLLTKSRSRLCRQCVRGLSLRFSTSIRYDYFNKFLLQ